MRAITSLAALALLAPAASAQILPVAEDLFNYAPYPVDLHTLGGGTGFSNNWYVGNSDIQVVDNTTTTPPFGLADPQTGFLKQIVSHGASYRVVDATLHPDVVDLSSGTPVFGLDGATLWFSFSAVRYAGAPPPVESYGGFRLFQQGCCEQLFLGSPWATGQWGIDDEGPNGPGPVTIPGTDSAVEARLVYRVDHLPGQERLRLWVNPAVPHPTGPADLDVMVHDFRWQEVSFQSGGNGGGLYYFDNLVIEKGTPANVGTNYCGPAVTNSTGSPTRIFASGSAVASQNSLTLFADRMPSNAFGFFLTSTTAGFVANPGGSQGNLCLSGAIGRYVGPGQIKNSGATGAFDLGLNLTQTPTPTGFVSVMAGQTRRFQAWHRDAVGGAATSNFSDGLEILFQ